MDRDSDSFAAIAPFNIAYWGIRLSHLSLSYHRCCIISVDPLRTVDKGLIQNSGGCGIAEGYRRSGWA